MPVNILGHAAQVASILDISLDLLGYLVHKNAYFEQKECS